VRLVEWADYLAQGGAARLTLDDSQKHPFALLNQSLGSDGVVLELAAGAELSEPVQILHLASGAVDDLAYFPRTVIHLEERARAVVVETFASLGEATYLRAPVLLASLRTGAKLDLYQRQDEGAGGYHFQYSQVQVGREAQLLMAHVATGGRQGRQDLAVNQTGPGAHTDLLGVYLGSGRQVLDNHTSLNHRAPQCTSRQVYKGILDDHALGIFNGRIFVQREAQRTDAQQSNRALLLSGDARINTKPQLEIFADDVRCTHGATVGQLDPDQQFYLRARGIGEHEARAMLTMAFVGEALMSIRLAAWRAAMEQELGQRFGVLDT
jgi:Fe-S cluster assembly protein SufD